ncbi:hypothetical protein D3C71_1608100 [compost metagenome]
MEKLNVFVAASTGRTVVEPLIEIFNELMSDGKKLISLPWTAVKSLALVNT